MTDLIETVARATYRGTPQSFRKSWEFLEDNHKQEMLGRIVDILRAIEAAGYRIVPVEPTGKMMKAFHDEAHHRYYEQGDDKNYYRAMIAAAPKVVP